MRWRDGADVLKWAGKDSATVALIGGVVAFAVVRSADEFYYSTVGIEPEEVGRNYTVTIGAAVGFAAFTLFAVALPGALLLRRRVIRLALVWLVVGVALSAMILLPSLAFSRSGPCGKEPRINAFRNDPSIVLAVNGTSSPVGIDRIDESTESTVRLVGIGPTHSILVDCAADPPIVMRLPSNDFVIYTRAR